MTTHSILKLLEQNIESIKTFITSDSKRLLEILK
ncbi:hypothetical protein [Aequorivita ciconiae]